MPAATPRPESQEEILDAALTALTEADVPPDDDMWAVPDPDCGRPAELADLTTAELDLLAGLAEAGRAADAAAAATPAGPPATGPGAAGPAGAASAGFDPAGLVPAEFDLAGAAAARFYPAGFDPAGCGPRDRAGGGAGFAGFAQDFAGFAQDGVLDLLPPGVPLAGFADAAHARLGALSDNELVGVMRAWWRQTSWAQANGLAAIAELARRRPADRTPPAAPGEFPAQLSEFIADEIAMALTLTRHGGEVQLDLALDLAARPATAAALAAGRIDLYKARIILEAVAPLSQEHAAKVEAAVLADAPAQTSGQLRNAVSRAVLKLDPEAARRRREQAQKDARVECWTDPEGTATLAGRSLPPAEVLAADKRLCQVAGWWKKQIRAAWKQADPHGHLPRPGHGTDLLRARAYLALLLGQPLEVPPADLLPPGVPGAGAPHGPGGSSSPDGPANPDGSAGPGVPAGAGGRAGADSAAGTGRPGPDDQHVPAGPDGTPSPEDQHVPAGPDGTPSPDGRHLPAGLRRSDPGPVPAGLRRGDPVAALPPLAGSIAVTLPLATLLGLSDNPGDVAGYGPLHGDIVRALANSAAGHPTTNWHLIITDPDDRAVGYGYAPRAQPIRGHPADGWTITLRTERIARGGPAP